MNNKNYDLIKFEDGDFSLDVNVSPSEDTVWLTLEQISLLFERDKSVISRHINNILRDFELNENSTVAFFANCFLNILILVKYFLYVVKLQRYLYHIIPLIELVLTKQYLR